MSDVPSTSDQLKQLQDRLDRQEMVIGTLISHLLTTLGENAAQDLLTKLHGDS